MAGCEVICTWGSFVHSGFSRVTYFKCIFIYLFIYSDNPTSSGKPECDERIVDNKMSPMEIDGENDSIDEELSLMNSLKIKTTNNNINRMFVGKKISRRESH